MASPNPVPSRAALAALRGIVFGTSCSVALLAEERRRRLKIAKTTLENARTLHTVKSRRRAAHTGDASAWRESKLSEDVDCVATFRQSRPDFLDSSQITQPWTNTTTDESPRLSAKTSKGNTGQHGDVQEQSRQGVAGPSVTLVDNTNTTSILRQYSQAAQSQPRNPWLPQNATRRVYPHLHYAPVTKSGRRAQPSFRLARKKLRGTMDNACLDECSGMEVNDHVTQAGAEINTPTDESSKALRPRSPSQNQLALHESSIAGPVRDSNSGIDESLDKRVDELVNTLSQMTILDGRHLRKQLVVLRHLINCIEADGTDNTVRNRHLELAAQLLDHLDEENSPLAARSRLLRSQISRLLKHTASRDVGLFHHILSVATRLPRSKSPIFVSFIQWALEFNKLGLIKDALTSLKDSNSSSDSEQHSLVYSFLIQFPQPQKAWAQTKLLYDVCKQAEPLDTIAITELLRVQGFMTRTALEAKDVSFALEEIGTLHTELSKFTQAGQEEPTFDEFQALLYDAVDLALHKCSSGDFEAVVRHFVEEYGLSLQQSWVMGVVAQHGKHKDLRATVSWLQYCIAHGFEVDQITIDGLTPLLRKYWDMGPRHLQRLEKLLIVSPSDDAEPIIQPNASTKRQKDIASGAHTPIEQDTFEQLREAQINNDWNKLQQIYQSAELSGLPFSSRCLRLAVLGHVAQTQPALAEAEALLDTAHQSGNNVGDAASPFLVARIRSSATPEVVLEKYVNRWGNFSDVTFNRIAKGLSAEGDLLYSARVCQFAAIHNGFGELLYNKHNFANLVLAYSRRGRYDELIKIVELYVSKVGKWQGDPICKEAIKYSKKVVIRRAEEAGSDMYSQWALHSLGKAYAHCIQCRTCARAYRRIVIDGVTTALKGRREKKGVETVA